MYYINLTKDSKPRYDFDKFMEFINGAFDVLTSYFLYQLKSLPPQGIFEVVELPYRPELISYEIYKDVNYWKIICIYNDIFDANEDIVIGTELSYPSITSLEKLYFSLKSTSIRET